jgi:hypothetical protein
VPCKAGTCGCSPLPSDPHNVFTLPLDIAFLIIDELGALSPRAASKAALRACALTCRGWRRRAHQHLFDTVCLGSNASQDYVRLKALHKRPDLCALAHSLVLDAAPKHLVAYLMGAMFINVRTRTLRIRPEQAMSVVADPSISRGRPALQPLAIFKSHLQPWWNMRIRVGLPNLRTVTLHESVSKSLLMRAITALAESPSQHNFAELTVGGLLTAELRRLGEHLAKLTAPRRLTFQMLFDRIADRRAWIPNFGSGACNGVMSHVCASFSVVFTGPCLQSSTLSHLSFTAPLVVDGLAYIRRLMDDARLLELRTLTVKFTMPSNLLAFPLPITETQAAACSPLLPGSVARALTRVELSFPAVARPGCGVCIHIRLRCTRLGHVLICYDVLGSH